MYDRLNLLMNPQLLESAVPPTEPLPQHLPTGTMPITVSLSEIQEILAHAVQVQSAWLKDFAEDPITLPADLYEVLVMFRRLRQTA